MLRHFCAAAYPKPLLYKITGAAVKTGHPSSFHRRVFFFVLTAGRDDPD
jgi:hypothetical protein